MNAAWFPGSSLSVKVVLPRSGVISHLRVYCSEIDQALAQQVRVAS